MNQSNSLLYTFSLAFLHVQGVEEECGKQQTKELEAGILKARTCDVELQTSRHEHQDSMSTTIHHENTYLACGSHYYGHQVGIFNQQSITCTVRSVG